MRSYIAPALTQYGKINAITGIIGSNQTEDFLTLNGQVVAEGAHTPSQSGSTLDNHSCDFISVNGGGYTLVSEHANGRCLDVLNDYLDPNSPGLDQDY